MSCVRLDPFATTLRRNELVGALADDVLEFLLADMSEHVAPAGTMLFSEGDAGDAAGRPGNSDVLRPRRSGRR